ncbi:DUF2855 family protein [Sneathiella marina]|uniref:DUF2855 family protein n=1 Tax=Sneathiella marina TaxID=2950108 RepID=A0ABY4W345_9PROT|nr:DUF2855 family protein [Sneathiella marina]USG61620.1 DUF2855 family protein [Sneathiella marina]
MQQLLVKKSDISQIRNVDTPSLTLNEGDVRLRVESFALTANNITYAVTGDLIGYWKFFPVAEDGWGIVPVWGHAVVIETACEGVDLGERLYGYFPMAEELIVHPTRVRQNAFTDGSDHRSQLPAVYNEYLRLNNSQNHDIGLEDLQSILYPLYATSYMIYDYLLDNDYFGAQQILIGSASSKTAIGLLQLLSDDDTVTPKIVGLTSNRNRDFVLGLEACDQVVTYDSIEEDIEKIPSVYVDMSGNADVRVQVHTHLQAQLLVSSSVGVSHWDKFRPTNDLPGAKPQMFFAPAQIMKRHDEWGPGVIQGKTLAAWRDLAIKSKSWLTVKEGKNLDDGITAYQELLSGKSLPTEGHVIRTG